MAQQTFVIGKTTGLYHPRSAELLIYVMKNHLISQINISESLNRAVLASGTTTSQRNPEIAILRA